MNHLSINSCHEKWLLFLRGLQHCALHFSASITAAGAVDTADRSTAARRGFVASSVKVMPPWCFAGMNPLWDIIYSPVAPKKTIMDLEKLEQSVFKSWELYTKTWCYCKIFVGCKANASSKAVTYFIAAGRKVWMLDVILNPHLVLQLPAVQHHAMEKSWYPAWAASDICQ